MNTDRLTLSECLFGPWQPVLSEHEKLPLDMRQAITTSLALAAPDPSGARAQSQLSRLPIELLCNVFEYTTNDGLVSPIVIDYGSSCWKVGFGGEDQPRKVFPSVVGRPRVPQGRDPGAPTVVDDCYVGAAAMENRGRLTLRYPNEQGIVTNWDDFEKLLTHSFVSLRASPEEAPVLIAEHPQGPKAPREKLTQLLFEKYNVPAAYVALQGVLSLYASGRTTGVVVETGHGICHTIPVFEGYALPHALLRFHNAGYSHTEYLRKMLLERGYQIPTHELGDHIKEQLCYVAMDFDEEMRRSAESTGLERTYQLPDGQEIRLNSERFRCMESVFKPSLHNWEHEGLHDTVYNTIMKGDEDIRSTFIGNIVLSGGPSMAPGFPERLQHELTRLPRMEGTQVVAAPERRYQAWIGGSILSSLSTFQAMWISQEEYNESGPPIVHRKCF